MYYILKPWFEHVVIVQLCLPTDVTNDGKEIQKKIEIIKRR